MRDLERAIADITSIRSQLAAGALFRCFGPDVIALTGVLAVATATAQSIWPGTLAREPWVFIACWVGVAVICVTLIAAEMMRSRRRNGALGDAMIAIAVERFMPSGVAGAALTVVILRFAPDAAWMLPGVWQILVAMGLFAAARNLPQATLAVGLWYLAAGLVALAVASGDRALAPWLMGAPFAVGQLMFAGVLRLASEVGHEEV
ncbi:MAG: hypothetical protein PVI23_16990 [Maricaulaceae bacterium]